MKNPLVITLLFIMTCYSCNNTVKDQKVMQELDVAVINQVTVTDYLSSGYVKSLTFDEFTMKGVGEPQDSRFVLIKDCGDSILVIRNSNLGEKVVYKKKSWGWFNRAVIDDGLFCYYYDRYLLRDRILEFLADSSNTGREYIKQLYIKTPKQCTLFSLSDSCVWNEDELPDLKKMNLHSGQVYKMVVGKKHSYYLCEESDGITLYKYSKMDSTTFSRLPGIKEDEKSLLKEYKYYKTNGVFSHAEVMPQYLAGEESLRACILENSDPAISQYVENKKIVVQLLVNTQGHVTRCKLVRPKDSELEKQLCQHLPVKFIPATIADQPVSVWYTLVIGNNSMQQDN